DHLLAPVTDPPLTQPLPADVGSSSSAAALKSPRRRAPKKSIMIVSRFSWPMLGIAPPSVNTPRFLGVHARARLPDRALFHKPSDSGFETLREKWRDTSC